ncbi:MAG: DUF4102 domain-containing protein [Rhodopseudomonas sp.]|nr:DUF4102 domain-containing protein [Rhodopseudomonas sp.]
MTRAMNRLSALTVKTVGPGKYADGGGLWLQKRDAGSGQWFLRITVHGRRREMGLGSISQVSLKEAREAAAKHRGVVRGGGDPIKERQRQRREASRNLHILIDVAKDAFEARKSELRGEGRAGRWFSPLELHVLPKLGKTPISDIDQVNIRDTLRPIWDSKSETAQKAISRLSIVFKHAAALGLDVDLQAVEKARILLGKSRHEKQHIPAMDWRDVPAFYASLNAGSVTHLALRLLILTGVRSRPVRFAREDQIENGIWVIPAEIIKGRRGKTSDFRVPLSSEAIAVIAQARRHARDGYLFPSIRQGVISDMTMTKLMDRCGLEARPHGFRSALRTWLAEATEAPREIAETILGHRAGGTTELSYRRTDFLEQRRALLARWNDFVAGKSGNVAKFATG